MGSIRAGIAEEPAPLLSLTEVLEHTVTLRSTTEMQLVRCTTQSIYFSSEASGKID